MPHFPSKTHPATRHPAQDIKSHDGALPAAESAEMLLPQPVHTHLDAAGRAIVMADEAVHSWAPFRCGLC